MAGNSPDFPSLIQAARRVLRLCCLIFLAVFCLGFVPFSLPDAFGAEAVPQETARKAAVQYARERWPGCRLVSLTPYYALSGEVNAWAGQVVKDADDPIQNEADLLEALGAVAATATGDTEEAAAEPAAEPSADSGAMPASNRPDSGRLTSLLSAESGRSLPIPGEPDDPEPEAETFDAADLALLADRVGTVLIAGRFDLYPLLERFDGVAPHAKTAAGQDVGQDVALAGAKSAAAAKVYYLGPFHVLLASGDESGTLIEARSGLRLASSAMSGIDGALPPAPADKNELTPASLWAELAGAPARKLSSSASTGTFTVPDTAKLVAGVPYYHQDDYGAEACGPTAAAQLLGYWDDNGFGNLVDNGTSATGHVAELVYGLMQAQGYTSAGTDATKIAAGLTAVCNTPAYGNGLNFATSSKSALNWTKDVTAELDAGRPFVYVNTDPARYPGWSHATTVVGYDASKGHILYLHWNFPPDSPYELNWDNIPPDNELQIKVLPNSAPFTCQLSEDFEGAFPDDWTILNNGTTALGWSTSGYRSHNQSVDPTPPGGNPAYSLYCGGAGKAPGPYVDGADAWIVRGPFSTLGKGAGEFAAYAWRDLATNGAVSLLASLDGESFYGSAWTGQGQAWNRLALNLAKVEGLGNVLNQPAVWLAARFKSEGGEVAEGVYLDDLAVNLYAINGWWWNSSLPGTGMSMEVQDDNLFLAWYVYDAAGRPVWYDCLAKRVDATTFSGELLECKGQPLGQPSGGFAQDGIGTVTVSFNSANRAVFSWTLAGGATGSVAVTRLLDDVAPGARDPRNLTGWWSAANYPGMGFFMEAQGGMLYLAWYHYREDGTARWWSLGGSPGNFPSSIRSLSGSFLEWSGGQAIGGPLKSPASTTRSGASLTFLQNGTAQLVVDGVVYQLARFDFRYY